MGASGYLAAKSEQEVYEHEIEVEKEEIRLMPDLEEDELALIYAARGMSKEYARELAQEVMRDPERALAEKIQSELKIGESYTTPMREGWITGSATAIGAFIPVAPFPFYRRCARHLDIVHTCHAVTLCCRCCTEFLHRTWSVSEWY